MPPARGTKPGRGDPRVDPHDPVGQPRQALHLLADQLGGAALPAVGQDHDHRAAGHPAPAVAVVERLQRIADPGAARPVRRRCGGALDRPLGVARCQRPGQPRQPRREHERLGVAARRRRRTSGTADTRARRAPSSPEMSHSITIRRRHHPAAAAGQADRIAAGAHALAQRPAHVDALAAAVASGAPGAAHAAWPPAGGSSAGTARRARRARARRSACRAARSSSLAAIGSATSPSAPAPGRPAGGRARRPGGTAPAWSACRSTWGRSSAAVGTVCMSSRSSVAVAPAASAEHREEHRVERLDLRVVGDQHGPGRPVQPAAADRSHQRQRPRETRPRARR